MQLCGITAELRPGAHKLRTPANPCRFGLPGPASVSWSWRRDLNPRPSDYKSDALPAELRQLTSGFTIAVFEATVTRVAFFLKKKPPCSTPAPAIELWNRLFSTGNQPGGPNVRGHTPTFRVHGSEIKVSTAPRPEQTRKNPQSAAAGTAFHATQEPANKDTCNKQRSNQ